MSAEAQNAISAWLRERDESAARELMEFLYPQVARIARSHLPFRMEEADLVQEIFAKLFLNLHRYDARLPLENWVSRVSINVCRDQLRARACRPELRWSDLGEDEQAAVEAALQAPDDAPDEAAARAKETLRKILETLSADDRLILSLLHLEEKTVAEIATLTGWSRPLVKVRAFRARARVRKAMATLQG
ncbi:MAG TPA: sigma-70 family RNA polymerase sigma factor [Chthoniobacteraceae bacterium]|jgi:RNA polymerase sigma-70 factor (ECF subfamily)|nr:sigma-70 family RNA polymerase sigma factor [Chthoniobacteraceae bacterium]